MEPEGRIGASVLPDPVTLHKSEAGIVQTGRH